MSNNRNPIKQWSITFPQSGDMERKDFADMFPPREDCVVAREQHEDGGNHLHMGIKFKKGITKSKLLEYISKKFKDEYKRIHIQATRNINNWNDYINKEDADVYREATNTQGKKSQEKIRKLILEEFNIDIEEWEEPDPYEDPNKIRKLCKLGEISQYECDHYVHMAKGLECDELRCQWCRDRLLSSPSQDEIGNEHLNFAHQTSQNPSQN